MSGETKAFDFAAIKPNPKHVPMLRPSKAPLACKTMVLDMGEASREEGFRLNGCR